MAQACCSGLLEVLGYLGGAEYLVDSPRFVERLVGQEADFRRELEIDRVGDLAPDELPIAVQSLKHGFQVLAAQRHDVDRGKPQVGRHAYLGDGHDVGGEHLVVDLAARQHLGQRVANELADAQLALGWACLAMVVTVGHSDGWYLSAPVIPAGAVRATGERRTEPGSREGTTRSGRSRIASPAAWLPG